MLKSQFAVWRDGQSHPATGTGNAIIRSKLHQTEKPVGTPSSKKGNLVTRIQPVKRNACPYGKIGRHRRPVQTLERVMTNARDPGFVIEIDEYAFAARRLRIRWCHAHEAGTQSTFAVDEELCGGNHLLAGADPLQNLGSSTFAKTVAQSCGHQSGFEGPLARFQNDAFR